MTIAAAGSVARAQAQPALPSSVTIYPPTNDYATNVMVASLAAAVNRNTNGELLISPDNGNQPNPRFWLDRLKEQYPSVQSQVQTNATVLLNQYRSHVSGYVLYDPANLHTVNIASSIAGLKNALVIPGNQELQYQLQGFAKQGDARTMTYQQAYDAFPNQFNKDMLFHQDPFTFSHQLRDFAMMNRGFMYWTNPTALAPFAAQQNPNGRIFGWANSEFDIFQQASQAQQQVVASNHNQSNSTTSKWNVPIQPQKFHTSNNVATKAGKHYVAFVMSDGDNATILNNEFGTHPSWFGNSHRGQFNMNWDFTPSLLDMNPVAHNWWYQQAADGSNGGRDTFVTAHGLGTTYPSDVPNINALVPSISAAMQRADQKVISILDNTYATSKLYPIVDDPQVLGMMYKTNSAAYKGRNGALEFRNGKPILSVKYSLWDKKVWVQNAQGQWTLVNHPDGASPSDIVNALNTNFTSNHDPIDNSASYSIINVHPWSKQFADGSVPTSDPNAPGGNVMDNVWQIVSSLDPNKFQVVGLEEMMINLRNHFGAPLPGAQVIGTWLRDNASGNFWDARANWSGAAPNFVDATVNFGTAITAARTINLNIAVTAGTVNFDNTRSYSLAGVGSLTLEVTAGNAQINVISGSHSISNPVTPADDTTITITPPTSTLTLGNLVSSTRAITKAGTGTLAVNNVRAGSLDIAAGIVRTTSGTSRLGTLEIAAGAKLDLQNTKLVVTGETLTDVESLINSGKLTTSFNTPNALTTLAIASNADLHKGVFGGLIPGSSDVLVMYTYAGDADLDGRIDGDDFFQIDAGINGHLSGYYNGDFDHNGSIDADDYFLIDSNYGGPAFSTASAVSAVPEPAAGAAALIALAGLCRRRR